MRSSAKSIDDYIAEFPAATRRRLQQVRRVILAAAPGATETISYAIPTFDLNGRHLVHFAGYERHVGFYPGRDGITVFEKDLAGYKQGKGSVQFPLDAPLPADLITKIVAFRVAAEAQRKPRIRRQPAAATSGADAVRRPATREANTPRKVAVATRRTRR